VIQSELENTDGGINKVVFTWEEPGKMITKETIVKCNCFGEVVSRWFGDEIAFAPD